VRAAARSIDWEAARLDRLVADLLDLSRVQSGMLTANLEAVELREVILRSLTRMQEAAGAAEAGPVVDVRLPETWVDADPVLLQQSIQNVLENTARHTAPGTAVRISTAAVRSGTWVRLTVEDAGQGVRPEALPRLFDRFYRQSAWQSSRRPGSGLGLAVAKGFVEAMGGTIAARPSELGGLAIDVELPATSLPVELAALA